MNVVFPALYANRNNFFLSPSLQSTDIVQYFCMRDIVHMNYASLFLFMESSVKEVEYLTFRDSS